MTVSNASTVYRYEGNGVTTVFAYSNRVLSTSDLEVKLLTRATDAEVETLALTTDYTVTIVNNSLANVTITNAAKIPSGTQDILISLDLAVSQPRSYPRADTLPAADVELGLDRLTLIAQVTNDNVNRSLRFPASDTSTDGTMPAKADRLGKFLAFDSVDGTPIATSVAVGDTPVSSFGATLVQAADAAAAKTTLAIPTISAFGETLVGAASAAAARTTLGIPFTAASSASGAALDFAEDTDNGTSKVVLAAPASLDSDKSVTLPSATGTLALLTDCPIVQVVRNTSTSMATGTTTIPLDDTIPTNTEGTEFLTATITPTNASNLIQVDVNLHVSNSISDQVLLALFKDSGSAAIAAGGTAVAGATMQMARLSYRMTAGGTAATTFRVRAGSPTAGTVTVNGIGGARIFGGVAVSSITLTEIRV